MLSVLAWGKFHGSLNLSQAEQGPQITQECVQNVTGLASPFPGVNPHVSTNQQPKYPRIQEPQTHILNKH
jgi:hypothetical protein